MTLKHIGVAFALAAATAAAPALAEPIMLDSSKVGESFTIDYDGFANGRTVEGLSAQTIFTLTGVNGSTYTFDYQVTNTSNSGVNARISSFAFDTNPEIRRARSTGAYSSVKTDRNYPNGIGKVDVCFKAARSGSCAGNRGGLFAGESGGGSLSLKFHSAPTSLTLDDFFVRYQSVSGAGHISSASGQQVSSTSTGGSTSGGTPVPAPGGMLALFAMALLGFGLVRRRPTAPLPTTGQLACS
ncbi:cistern family PEP-CTERM protein [Erythrobacter sp. THAF29]|uniref:cistern family PEP-CTERM protein n=1 Tax=Erythrobacter sp. THAF29 TaxID=2587851 RepID=UPI001268D63E|nr:cistern family PEP-CTERM protein [Erythrobacter sp. THAF29]QFT78867.1 hypothetical protein FIU90_15055 [Erythrobacter sp. THAF29]